MRRGFHKPLRPFLLLPFRDQNLKSLLLLSSIMVVSTTVIFRLIIHRMDGFGPIVRELCIFIWIPAFGHK
jgi:hypothetical protein